MASLGGLTTERFDKKKLNRYKMIKFWFKGKALRVFLNIEIDKKRRGQRVFCFPCLAKVCNYN